MNRRNLLGGILAAGFAPAFVGADVLMPVRRVWAPDAGLWFELGNEFWGGPLDTEFDLHIVFNRADEVTRIVRSARGESHHGCEKWIRVPCKSNWGKA